MFKYLEKQTEKDIANYNEEYDLTPLYTFSDILPIKMIDSTVPVVRTSIGETLLSELLRDDDLAYYKNKRQQTIEARYRYKVSDTLYTYNCFVIGFNFDAYNCFQEDLVYVDGAVVLDSSEEIYGD